LQAQAPVRHPALPSQVSSLHLFADMSPKVMKLRTDTIGHFESPTEDIIRDAVAYSGEGAHEGDL